MEMMIDMSEPKYPECEMCKKRLRAWMEVAKENAELKERIELVKKITLSESRGDVSMVIDDSRSGYISAMRCVLYNLDMPIEELRKE